MSKQLQLNAFLQPRSFEPQKASVPSCDPLKPMPQEAMEDDRFSIQPSHIKAAGLGLYTKIDLPPDTLLLPYTGETLTDADIDKRYGQNGHAGYALKISNNLYVDAIRRPRCMAAFTNDAKGPDRVSGLRNNCKLVKRKHAMWLSSGSKQIKAGSELCTYYGSAYWVGISKSIIELPLDEEEVILEEDDLDIQYLMQPYDTTHDHNNSDSDDSEDDVLSELDSDVEFVIGGRRKRSRQVMEGRRLKSSQQASYKKRPHRVHV